MVSKTFFLSVLILGFVERSKAQTTIEVDRGEILHTSQLSQFYPLEPSTTFNINDGGFLDTVREVSFPFSQSTPDFDFGGSAVNINNGGTLGSPFLTTEESFLSNVTLSLFQGGVVNDRVRVYTGSTTNVFGGSLGFDFQSNAGSSVNVFGGSLGVAFLADSGSSVNLFGGSLGVGFQVNPGGTVRLFGSDFEMDSQAILETPVGLRRILTGTLSDGSPFILPTALPSSPFDSVANVVTIPSPTPTADLTPKVVDHNSASAPNGLRAGQSLTLREGGQLNDGFVVLDANLNIEGGESGQGMSLMGANALANISGGVLAGGISVLPGASLNITGGHIFAGRDAFQFARIQSIQPSLFFPETFSLTSQEGTSVNITGGRFDGSVAALAASSLTVSGGRFIGQFVASPGSTATLFGGDFKLNGVAFSGSSATLSENDLLTGTLLDGSPFIFSPQDGDQINGVNLINGSIPAISQEQIVIETAEDEAPNGLRQGQTLTVRGSGRLDSGFRSIGAAVVVEGGEVGASAEAAESTISISAGEVGVSFKAHYGTTVDINGGMVGSLFEANFGSIVNINGGSVGSSFDAKSGSIVNINGGSVGSSFDANSGSIVNINGGSVGNSFDANSGSAVNIRGGVLGDDFDANAGSSINFIGLRFFVDDTPLDLELDAPIEIPERDVVLSGLLADGSWISIELTDNNISSLNFFSPDSTVTVSLVASSGLAGDYNNDGTVDAADYTVWRDRLSEGVLPNETATPGLVTVEDYLVWKENFGASTEPSLSSGTVAPEPATLVLLGMCFCRPGRRWTHASPTPSTIRPSRTRRRGPA